MGFLDFFRPVPNLSTEDVRQFLLDHDPEQFHLLDVRQPKEYRQGHLPGALLIPLNTLADRLRDLDPDKTAITYCAAGPRSRAAASMLINAGFSKVFNMAGGIRAWEGGIASGDPKLQTAQFSSQRTPIEHLALAWLLEDGSRAFYAAAAAQLEDQNEAAFMQAMAKTEENHQQTLADRYQKLSGSAPDSSFPYTILGTVAGEKYLEGGLRLSEVLNWLRDKSAKTIIEFAMAMEANAYDHYLLLQRKLPEEKSRAIFALLAKEEQAHLHALTEHLERFIEGN